MKFERKNSTNYPKRSLVQIFLFNILISRSLRRVRKDVVQAHDALRLLKQPRGDTRAAVRSADYMAQTLRLVHDKVHHVHKRSLNATGQS